jgi:hypothetical protein
MEPVVEIKTNEFNEVVGVGITKEAEVTSIEEEDDDAVPLEFPETETPTKEEPKEVPKERTHKLCDVLYCVRAGTEHCGECKRAHYCTREHQLMDWPSHKFLCKHPERDRVIDGYKLCNTILRSNDNVRTDLAGKVFDRIEKGGSDYEGDVIIHTKCNQEGDVFKMVNTPLLFLENGVVDEDGLKAYWAVRSAASGYTMNATLHIMLEQYRSMGYHTVIFDKLGMPLDDSLTLEFFCIAPNFKLRVEDPSQNPPKLGDILTEVVCTKDYTITLASGLFWKFEEGGIYPYRPIHIAKHLEFVKPIGTLTNVPKNQTRHKDRMYKNENICSSVASVLYLTTQNMGIPYPKTHPHVDGAEIMLQADKLHIAKMAKGQDYKEWRY